MATDADNMRKLATELREAEAEFNQARMVKVSHVLNAARGLVKIQEAIRHAK